MVDLNFPGAVAHFIEDEWVRLSDATVLFCLCCDGASVPNICPIFQTCSTGSCYYCSSQNAAFAYLLKIPNQQRQIHPDSLTTQTHTCIKGYWGCMDSPHMNLRVFVFSGLAGKSSRDGRASGLPRLAVAPVAATHWSNSGLMLCKKLGQRLPKGEWSGLVKEGQWLKFPWGENWMSNHLLLFKVPLKQ